MEEGMTYYIAGLFITWFVLCAWGRWWLNRRMFQDVQSG